VPAELVTLFHARKDSRPEQTIVQGRIRFRTPAADQLIAAVGAQFHITAGTMGLARPDPTLGTFGVLHGCHLLFARAERRNQPGEGCRPALEQVAKPLQDPCAVHSVCSSALLALNGHPLLKRPKKDSMYGWEPDAVVGSTGETGLGQDPEGRYRP